MTGGDSLNFDQLMKDHKMLIGKWKSTNEINLAVNDSVVDEMWSYFIFDSVDEGRLEYHTINSKKLYTAHIDVRWHANKIEFIQSKDAVCSNGDAITKDEFVCTPNKLRLLEVSCQKNGKERFKFLLEKVY